MITYPSLPRASRAWPWDCAAYDDAIRYHQTAIQQFMLIVPHGKVPSPHKSGSKTDRRKFHAVWSGLNMISGRPLRIIPVGILSDLIHMRMSMSNDKGGEDYYSWACSSQRFFRHGMVSYHMQSEGIRYFPVDVYDFYPFRW